ncbi:MAG TPA: rod shape-determining protein MreD [Gemmatimonadaceae bacterium]|nr:rod shape-determining protein MreD [Gemmatimonadaceae bacterium]
MTVGAAFRTAIVVAVLLVMQFAVQPLMPWRVSPDFLVIALLYAAVRIRPGSAAVLGFALGLVTDSLSLGGFGAGALALTIVGFGASWLKAVFFADNLAINAAFLFLGKWAFDVLYALARHTMSLGQTLAQILLWSVLSAAFTAVVGVVVLAILRPLDPAEARPR